jgi:DNA-binding transcriptional ArsR family regulator
MRSKNATAPLDHIFYALSDPTRRNILAVLSKGDATVGELAGRSSLSPPAISKHLKVLEKGNLIHRKEHPGDGRALLVGLEPQSLGVAVDWLEKYRRYWNAQFDALEKFLETQPPKEEKHGAD